MKRVLPLLVAWLTLASATRAEWLRTATTVGWIEGGERIWEFSFDTAAGKPFFHPLRVPGGPALTAARPDDHPWHYGLWFSWKFINGANAWEEDRATGRAEVATAWSPPHIRTFRDGRAEIALRLDYVHPSGSVDLTETRFLAVSPVAADGSYAIDWTSTFTAGPEGALLDRTPLPHEPNGVVYGGYAGLSLRLAPGETPAAFTHAEGPMTDWVDNRLRPRTRAVAVTVYPKTHDSGSIAVLAHADNQSGAGNDPWYCINGQPSRFLCAAVLVPQPVLLAADETWTLRYRLLLRREAWTATDIQTALVAWTE